MPEYVSNPPFLVVLIVLGACVFIFSWICPRLAKIFEKQRRKRVLGANPVLFVNYASSSFCRYLNPIDLNKFETYGSRSGVIYMKNQEIIPWLEGFAELPKEDRDYLDSLSSKGIFTPNEVRQVFYEFIKHNRRKQKELSEWSKAKTQHAEALYASAISQMKEDTERSKWVQLFPRFVKTEADMLNNFLLRVVTMPEDDRYFLARSIAVGGMDFVSVAKWLEHGRREFAKSDMDTFFEHYEKGVNSDEDEPQDDSPIDLNKFEKEIQYLLYQEFGERHPFSIEKDGKEYDLVFDTSKHMLQEVEG